MGLISKNMPAADTPAEEQAEALPGQAPEAAPDNEQGEDEHPAYQAAIDMARQVLYANGAAKDVARALRSASDPVTGLAETAYEMVSTIDEKTQGQVPDELMVSLAAEVLGEVADIGEAAGIKLGGKEISAAMQQMLVRYLTENGIDPSQLQQAMSKVDQDQLGAMLDQHAGAQEPVTDDKVPS